MKQVTFPTSTLFTISELHSLNPHFKEITLRVRLTKEIEDGRVAEIGAQMGERGRPTKVFTFTPVTKDTLNEATKQQLNLVDDYISFAE